LPAASHTGKAATDRVVGPSTVSKSACNASQSALSGGKVIYQKGYPTLNGRMLRTGELLSSEDIISTASDGYVALELISGSVVSIQPDTSASVGCAISAAGDSDVQHPEAGAHMLGGIRG